MFIVVIAKIKSYHCRQTGRNKNVHRLGVMCVVKRKQYLSSIVVQIIKKTKSDNIPAFIINSHSNWKKVM